MHTFTIGERRYVQFERLRRESGLAHAYSTRPQDVGPRRDGDLNAETRVQVARDIGLPPEALRHSHQVHGTEVAHVESSTPPGGIDDVDGLLTTLVDVPLMTFSADCPLVLAYDARRRVLGMVHASWRGTVAHASRRLIERMREAGGAEPADMLVGIGPSAGPCCYEVKEDVHEAAHTLSDRDACFASRDGRLYFDLWQANVMQLADAGVAPENVEVAGMCTLCRNDVFFSYRKQGAAAGRFGLIAGLRRAQWRPPPVADVEWHYPATS